ncbi:hypothetical protein KEG38_43235 [Polyangium jinanense]|uniref:hypothetical protein n=1 Tax=Polyangium jinanense TaxID=2829994 RepID=UPI002340F7EC|nr:hypothetical protein [Polyangium jinanense]MDC3960746.1 hypothetical protein [Polyangium jinanense]
METLQTELLFASDGTIYVHFEDTPPAGRRVFAGYALTAEERAQHGARGLLRWACLQLLAVGSDGCVYVEQGAINAEGRKEFHGYALTDEEAARMFEEFHRTALNLTIAARTK